MENEKNEMIIELNKLERQLILYKYFSSPCIKMREEALSLYGIPRSTVYKDMKDLTDAGLIHLRYDKELGEYVAADVSEKTYSQETDKPNRVKHLRRLVRLARCMRELYNEPIRYEYNDYEDYEERQIIFIKGKKSCKDCYQEMFPEESTRTMQRDFVTLTRIGYPIRYNRELRAYDFYDDTDVDWEEPYVDGVFIDEETGKLCRRCGEDYDLEMQENYLESIRGMRQGLPLDEWEPF